MPKTKKHKHRFLNFVKGTTKAGVGTILKTDQVKAKLGSGTAKNRLGLFKEAVGQTPTGPSEFTARFEGKKGRIVLGGSLAGVSVGGGVSSTTKGCEFDGPLLCFTTTGTSVLKALTSTLSSHSPESPTPPSIDPASDPGVQWTLPIHTIREVRKISGMGWKGKLVAGWSMGQTIADGVNIVDREGREWRCTAIQLRDELFNRLLAICPQVWETC